MEGKEKRLYIAILGLIIILAGLCGYIAASAASASDASSNGAVHTITVSGTGTVSIKATVFSTYVGVETQANTTTDALSQNAERMSGVVPALRALGLTDNEIETSQFSSFDKRANVLQLLHRHAKYVLCDSVPRDTDPCWRCFGLGQH